MASNRNPLDRLTCRQVLNIMVILGFMFNYMLRVNLTIAIVSMVVPDNDPSHQNGFNYSSSGACGVHRGTVIGPGSLKHTTIGETATVPIPVNSSNRTSHRSSSPSMDAEKKPEETKQTRYPWNEYDVNIVLGSFFWGYICTELPGGRLAETIGAKRVFGYSMLVSSAITLLTPLATTYGYVAVAALRTVLGFMLGATWPAIQPMTARWIPPTERSKFVSNMMASSLGAAVTMPICGFLIASLGWESVFYVTGAIGLLWSVSWFLLIFDSPAEHPRISDEERRYIEDAIGSSTVTKGLPVPWKSIFRSAPVWAIVVTHGCSVFGYFTVVNQLPTYMKYILDFNIKQNGMLSSLPYLGKYIFAVATASLADHLLKKKMLSVTAIRKIFTTFAVMSPGLLMIALAYQGCDRVASVAIFTIALTINGAVTAGYLGNGLDIAPNFSGTIFGLANTLSSLGGFLSSHMVGSITYKNQTYAQWTIIFWILAATYCTGALTFAIFGTGELQKWNNPVVADARNKENDENVLDVEESLPLKGKTIS
ncbi:PREDICTED: putative inorganic phosphate cotransporter [Dufourea novaeangliae]|uniref:putative inorganic phosphate cotransporter n=1 Tax=Dufourea novaeangliae TaxID=178035 RepID=UPI000767C2AC|nr:PREDICTED: putative inorganic phosphate cotransporter [Dufourea novaeangliae]XP_015433656.1 PREDICTED: putative inorganic phosphate cotransporter [Dufourea novaeangliae]